MVTVNDGRTGDALTLPFGPLRLMDLAKGDADKARGIVDEGLDAIANLKSLEGGALYAVGGIWRSFARVDMEEMGYPLHVLQATRSRAAARSSFAKCWRSFRKKSLDKMKVVSKRRAESLPYGAVVLERLLLAARSASEMVISAYGLREGLLFEQLSADERARDPLIEFAAATNARISRAPAHAEEMFEWASPLFADETSRRTARAPGGLPVLRHRLAAPSRRPRARRLQPGADRTLRRRRPPGARLDRRRRVPSLFRRRGFSPGTGAGRSLERRGHHAGAAHRPCGAAGLCAFGLGRRRAATL